MMILILLFGRLRRLLGDGLISFCSFWSWYGLGISGGYAGKHVGSVFGVCSLARRLGKIIYQAGFGNIEWHDNHRRNDLEMVCSTLLV